MRSLYGLRRALRFFFPIRCACCHEVIFPTRSGICDVCMPTAKTPQIPVCPYCAQEASRCTCRRGQRYYARCSAPFYYEGSVRQAIYHLKEHRSATAAQVLGYHMYRTLRRDMPHLKVDALVPVPLSPNKKRLRGYNQSLLLCRALSHYMHKPVWKALIRRNSTERFEQKQLPYMLRTGNVLGVFDMEKDISVQGKVILLVDDTRTTGATLDECAKVLRLAGAKSVYVCVAATVPYKKEKDEE